MLVTKKVKRILAQYEGESPGTKANLARMLMHGKLKGTGKMVILPVDQGFEHGPARSFAANPEGYDPHYHFKLAVKAGLSAFAAPLGMLAAGADSFAGSVPLILKMNSANSLAVGSSSPDQAVTATVKDALRLGCAAVGFTIYPSSDKQFPMFEELSEIIREAKSYGLAAVVWSYPRGGLLTTAGETAIDVISYACHIAALLGADIIKVKLPTAHIEQEAARKVYVQHKIPIETLAQRVAHVKQAAFSGRRLVIFSGGATKSEAELYEEIRQICAGGGDGSIIGRNAFQRPLTEAIDLLNSVMRIYAHST